MSCQRTLESEIIRRARTISLIGLAGLLLLAGITVGEVLLRWLFSYPIQGVSDVSRLIVTIVVASCFPIVSAERKHIAVRAVGSVLGPRVHYLLEAFGAFVTLVIFSLMTWQLWLYANELAASNQTTWLIEWRLAPWWRVATILLGLCVPIQLLVFLVSLKSAFSVTGVDRVDPRMDEALSKKEDLK